MLSDSGISLYYAVMPTYSLLLSLANFNINVAVSKRISEKANVKKTIISSCYIMFFLNLFLILATFLLARFVSFNLLKNKMVLLPLLCSSLTLPFVSIGYIIKGYFYGKQRMLPHMVSNVIEQIFRLFIISLWLPKIIRYGTVISVCALILFNILSESVSILVFFFFLPHNFKIKKEDISISKEDTKELLNLSLPSVSGRIIGNIGYFLEPIILTNILLYKGFDLNFITLEYGAYNAYAISLLLFPSFFITAISNSLLPELSRLFEEKKKKEIKKRLKEAVVLSLVIGLLCTGFIYLFKEKLLNVLYNTNEGIEYIKVLAPFFVLFYLESPLSSALIALGKVKACTKISVSGILLKLGAMALLAYLGFGMYSLVIVEIANIIYVTLLDIYCIYKVIYT